jgi:hypothetical protein
VSNGASCSGLKAIDSPAELMSPNQDFLTPRRKGHRQPSPTTQKKKQKMPVNPCQELSLVLYGYGPVLSPEQLCNFPSIHGIPRSKFRVLSLTPSYEVLGLREDLGELASAVTMNPRTATKDRVRQISDYLLRVGATDAGSSDLLSTPPELRAAGYSFREVDDSNGLWAKWRIYKKFQPQLVVFLNKGTGLTVEGFSTHQSPLDMITTSSSDSSDTQSSSDEQSESRSTTSTDPSLYED